MGKLHYETATKTVTDIVNLFENGQLNLSPAFQKGLGMARARSSKADREYYPKLSATRDLSLLQ